MFGKPGVTPVAKLSVSVPPPESPMRVDGGVAAGEVVAAFAVERVGAEAAGEPVVARPAAQPVVADAAVEPVGAFAAEEAVVAALAVEDVVAAFAEDRGDVARQPDHVRAGRADDRRPDGFRPFGAARCRAGSVGQHRERGDREQHDECPAAHTHTTPVPAKGLA